jgi:hypothetical protein
MSMTSPWRIAPMARALDSSSDEHVRRRSTALPVGAERSRVDIALDASSLTKDSDRGEHRIIKSTGTREGDSHGSGLGGGPGPDWSCSWP